FYAAVHFQPANPQWKDFGTLNQYVTRVQSFLQSGKPDNDVLLYYPIIDRYSQAGGELLQHFDGMERNFEGTDFEYASKWMLEHGYSFDFFSDRQLQKISTSGSRLMSGGNQYKIIFLPANKLISDNSFQKLMNLAKGGAVILVYKTLPQDVPGFALLENRRKLFQQLVAQLNFSEEGKIKKAIVGKGAFYIGDDLEALLSVTNVRKEELVENGFGVIRRKNADGYTYFINNRTDKPFGGWVSLNAAAESVALFDAMTGKNGLAKWRIAGDGMIQVWLQLTPFESIIAQTYSTKKTGAAYVYFEAIGKPKKLNDAWTISFLNGGPSLPAKQILKELGSWTELEGEEVKNFSGTARYATSFAKPPGSATAWLLDLGKVNETVEVFLNGKKLTTLIGPTFQTTIPSYLLNLTNTLEVVVANLMANRISYMDRNSIPWKIFYNTNMPARRRENSKKGIFDASSWKPLASGLTGPVSLTPLAISMFNK
ncbi:MAG: glycosylhydrolase-like jelly roll fold domain-containing protein, partial [Ferruginibacter sp.]